MWLCTLFIHLDECLDATTKGLWKTDLNWSRDARELRKAAVASQEKAIFKQAKKHLKHLRIIDKKVYTTGHNLLWGVRGCLSLVLGEAA